MNNKPTFLRLSLDVALAYGGLWPYSRYSIDCSSIFVALMITWLMFIGWVGSMVVASAGRAAERRHGYIISASIRPTYPTVQTRRRDLLWERASIACRCEKIRAPTETSINGHHGVQPRSPSRALEQKLAKLRHASVNWPYRSAKRQLRRDFYYGCLREYFWTETKLENSKSGWSGITYPPGHLH